MKALFILLFFLIACVPAKSNTNDLSINFKLDDKQVLALTSGFEEYQDAPVIKGKLISAGSGLTTILVNRWASEFLKLHPEAELNIQSGGSVEGLEKLIAGKVDLVPLGRELPARDISRFKAKFGYEPTQIIVAQDAVGVYVNRENPVAGLTLSQLERIFSRQPPPTGTAPELWGDLGVTGSMATQQIYRVSLNRIHATHLFFKEQVLHGGEYRLSVNFEPVPSSLVQAAGAYPNAIGCTSVIFGTRRTRLVPLQASDGSWVLPTYSNVVNGHYPLVRPLRIVFNRKPDGTMNPVARELLRFAVSRRGQRIIGLADTYPITPELQKEALRVLAEKSGSVSPSGHPGSSSH